MFHGYIALRKACPACALDYAMFDAGDGPMVFGILIVGAIVCGLALWVEFSFQPPLWVHAALWLPLSVILALVLLPRIKGAVIALLWAHRIAAPKPSTTGSFDPSA